MLKLFVPYYNEIKIGGHMACALVGAFAGGTFMWAFSLFIKKRLFKFFHYYGIALFAASALWIIPATISPETLPWGLSSTIIMAVFFPLIKIALPATWRQAAILWFAFWLSQAFLFIGIYFHIA